MADPDVTDTPRATLATACDEVDALADLLWLTFLAGEGMVTRDGAAFARAALLALDRVAALREALSALESDAAAAAAAARDDANA